MRNQLYYGDNLDVLRSAIADDSVDLIYLDPPFNSNADYNALFKTPKGQNSAAQMEAFTDTWQWDDATSGQAVKEVKQSSYQDAAKMLDAMVGFLGKNALTAYLAMMAVRLIELHRVLKPTGSLYLHCDPTASHYLKILLDAVFGARAYRNDIVWKRAHTVKGNFGQGSKFFDRNTDNILFYSKSERSNFHPIFKEYSEGYLDSHYNLVEPETGRRYQLISMLGPGGKSKGNPEYEVLGVTRAWRYTREKMAAFISEGVVVQTKPGGVPRKKRYLDEGLGVPVQALWDDIAELNSQAKERLGYPTQKPVALLERILNASSNPGDVVLDPFCGCGTTVHAAQKLGRNWIGIDVTHIAIGLIETRLRDAFPGIDYQVFGTPMDAEAARDFFNRNDPTKKEFEKWAVTRIGFLPQSKKGADGGLDGVRWFGRDEEFRAVVSVKGGGKVGVEMVRSLDAVITAQGAHIGVLLTLEPPTKPMQDWAKSAGMCEVPGFAPVNRIQIVTIEQALSLRERAVEMPARRDDTFKKAPREEKRGAQGALDL